MKTWLPLAHLVGLAVWLGGLSALNGARLWAQLGEPSARRLHRWVLGPALFTAFFSGIWMLHQAPHWLTDRVFRLKLVCVVALLAMDHLGTRSLSPRLASARFFATAALTGAAALSALSLR